MATKAHAIPKEYEPFLTRRSLGYRLKKLSALLSRELNESLVAYDLTRNHWVILGCLWQRNGVPVCEISRQVQQVGGTISGVLDRMEKRKLIRRKRDRKDKRIWRVWLTDQGSELINVLPPVVKGIWDRALGDSSQADKMRFSALVDLALKNCCPGYFSHLPEADSGLSAEYMAMIPPKSLGYRLKLLSLVIGRIFTDRAEEYNVTVSHWIVLCRLWQDDGASVSEVGGYIEQVGGTLAGVLERMEERGLIERRQHNKDKRCWKVWLTPAGASLSETLPPIAKSVLDTFTQSMAPDDLEFFSEFVDKLTLNLAVDTKPMTGND